MKNLEHWKMMLEALNNLQERVEMSEPVQTDTDNPENTGKYFLPTIKITEDWGRIGSKDRQIIEKFTRNIGGTTLAEKIANINKQK